MSDADEADDELEAIRRRKREELSAAPDGAAGTDEQSATDAPTQPVHVESEDHFATLVDDNRVLLVDFHADWCGPCKMLEPIVADVAAETSAAVAKVDVDAHGALAQEYRVQGVPTLYLFVDGEPAERLVGVQEKAALVDLVESHA